MYNTNEIDVFKAIVKLNEASDLSEVIEGNDVLDEYLVEHDDDDPISELINRYTTAGEEYDSDTVDRIIHYAYDYLRDEGLI